MIVADMKEYDPSKFQFPTNGKALLNLCTSRHCPGRSGVSIPYERESTSEPGESAYRIRIQQLVSIPYERESTSEHVNLISEVLGGMDFGNLSVSIPYERESTSERP